MQRPRTVIAHITLLFAIYGCEGPTDNPPPNPSQIPTETPTVAPTETPTVVPSQIAERFSLHAAEQHLAQVQGIAPIGAALLFDAEGKEICLGIAIAPQWLASSRDCAAKATVAAIQTSTGTQAVSIAEVHLAPFRQAGTAYTYLGIDGGMLRTETTLDVPDRMQELAGVVSQRLDQRTRVTRHAVFSTDGGNRIWQKVGARVLGTLGIPFILGEELIDHLVHISPYAAIEKTCGEIPGDLFFQDVPAESAAEPLPLGIRTGLFSFWEEDCSASDGVTVLYIPSLVKWFNAN